MQVLEFRAAFIFSLAKCNWPFSDQKVIFHSLVCFVIADPNSSQLR